MDMAAASPAPNGAAEKPMLTLKQMIRQLHIAAPVVSVMSLLGISHLPYVSFVRIVLIYSKAKSLYSLLFPSFLLCSSFILLSVFSFLSCSSILLIRILYFDVGKKYPERESEFVTMGLPGKFEPEKAGKRMKLPTPETWETLLSEKGNKVPPGFYLPSFIYLPDISFF